MHVVERSLTSSIDVVADSEKKETVQGLQSL